jgi:coenzyme F420-0:L-glutamate ligase/coenzyme F420-1:gamma-L-glutamate ligase
VIRIFPLTGIPEVLADDDLAGLLGDAVERLHGLEEGDVLVVAQKVVSKAEGRVEEAGDVLEVILREARAVRRRRGDLVIAETEHGFVCASAGSTAPTHRGTVGSCSYHGIPMPRRPGSGMPSRRGSASRRR